MTLAFAMSATMIPGKAFAEETVPDAQEAQVSDLAEDEETATKPVDESAKNEVSADDVSSNDTAENDVTTDKPTSNDAKLNDATNDVASDNTAADDSADKVADEEGQSPEGDTSDENDSKETTGNADVVKPVIEKVELMQQGQTLHEGDTVEVRVDAYDADSGISNVEITMTEDDETGYESAYLSAEYDEAEDCYIGTYTFDELGTGKINITQVRVIDNNSNYADAETWGDGGYLYWFYTENDMNTVAPERISFPTGGELITAEDSGKFSLQFAENVLYDSASIYVSVESENGSTDYFYLYGEDNGTYQDAGLYLSTEGTYKVTSVEIERLGEDLQISVPDMDQYSFTYQKDPDVPQEDTEAPVITSVSLDKNGDIVKAGDVVTITVKAEDNVGLESTASAYFSAVSDIIDDWQWVDLTYSDEQQAYVGTFEITEDTYPCEWYLEGIDIWDNSSNSADDGSFLWEEDYPYYVQVYSGNTFVNPTYTVECGFWELDEDGDWYRQDDTIEVTVERRQTLKEAGVEFPEIESKYDGFRFTGWLDDDGNEILPEDIVITSDIYQTYYAGYDKLLIDITYAYMDEDGKEARLTEQMTAPVGTTYGDLADQISSMAYPGGYSELEFAGWKIENNADDLIPRVYSSIYVIADYTEVPVRVNYSYIDTDGNWTTDNMVYSVEKGTTRGELNKIIEAYAPENATAEYTFDSWQYNSTYFEDDDTVEYIPDMVYTAKAKYKGKNVILINQRYYDKDGVLSHAPVPFVIDEGTGPEIMDTYVQELDAPDGYEGLRFAKWNHDLWDDEELMNGTSVIVYAEYENCMIRFIIDQKLLDGYYYYNEKDVDAIFCLVAEKGDTVTVPYSFEGYEDITYLDGMTDKDEFVVEYSGDFLGYAAKVNGEPTTPEEPGTDPDEPTTPEEPGTDPDEPTTPEDPTKPEKPVAPNPPAVELPQESVAGITEMVVNASEGQKIDVNMGDATVVPEEVLRAARGRDVTIELQMNGYTWTINGQDIAAKDLSDINLEVTLNSNAIPGSTVKKLAGDNPVQQLSLTHNGDFGFRAELSFNIGSEYAGKYGNLYYYDSTGRMVFMNAGTIREDGMISLSFSHASDYVVVISDQKMSQADVPADLQPSKDGTNTTNDGNVAKTGDASPIIPTLIVLILAAVVIAGVVVLKKRAR